MGTFNGKFSDDSVQIKDRQFKNGRGSAPVPGLFSHIFRITGNDISQYTEACELLLDYSKIGGDDNKYVSKKATRNIFMKILMYTAED